MCGIAGILKVHPPGEAPPPHDVAIPEAWLDILDDSIKHRGPDGHGRFRDRATRPDGTIVDVALVHRRLSILDHAGGHQPMVLLSAPSQRASSVSERDHAGAGSHTPVAHAPGVLVPPGSVLLMSFVPPGADEAPYRRTLQHVLRPCPRCAALGKGTIAVAFNGCIYNHRDLRRELQAAGHEFTSDHSDTEVLVHGWGEWEEHAFEHLEGMFAAAHWDPRRCALVLSRDQFGEKPLHGVSWNHDGVECRAFASTAAGLYTVLGSLGPKSPATVNGGILTWLQFGFGGDPPGEFGFTVRPSQYLDVTPRRPAPAVFRRLFSAPGPPRRTRTWSPADAQHLLEEAVTRRLEADVPLGCFLSGGVDSSLVACFAKRAAGSLQSFSMRFPDARFDETEFASRAASVIGCAHTILDCRPSLCTDLVSLICRLGLPIGDSSLLPTHWVSQAAREHVKVALSGDGGDELFAGYERHLAARLLSVAGDPLALVPPRLPWADDPRSRMSRLARLGNASRNGYPELAAVFERPLLERLAHGRASDWAVNDSGRRHRGVSGALLWDLLNYLPGDLMGKVDTASMHHALEVRCPFLDTELARASMECRVSSLMPGGQRKGLLRAVARKYLPADIVDRPKQGFAIPIGEWFRSDFGGLRQLLLDHLVGPEPFGPDHLGVNAMINMNFVRRMLKEHDDAGTRSLWPWKGRDHSQRLYMLLVLSIWAKWLGGLDRA